MADLSNNGDGDSGLSMEKRLLLAFLLMGAVLFLSPYFLKTDQPAGRPAEEPVAEAPSAVPAPAEEEQEGAAASEETAEPVEASAEAVSAETEETVTIETDLYRISFTNRGAVVTNWVLKNYADNEGEPLDLVNHSASDRVPLPFSLVFNDSEPALNPNNGLYAVSRADDGLGVEFELSNGVTSYRKSFQFERGSYVCQVVSEAVHDSRRLPHLLVWRGGFGDTSRADALTVQKTIFSTNGKIERKGAKEGKDGPVTFSGAYSFAGIEDAYFAAVALPGNGQFQLRAYTDNIPFGEDQKEQPHAGMAIGGKGRNEFPLFVGPKDVDILASVDPRLKGVVDFGWFSFLASPLFMALKWINDNWAHNYGWSIVILTILINTLLMPLKYTSMKSMKQMQVLQPEVKAIQDKYKGMSMRDPRRQEQNEELMKLYQKHNVNPIGGCVPMALQIPFFFAFYQVLRAAIELRGADWLWVADLSQPETLPIRILPVTMIASQFAMQRMTPTAAANPSQQRIMMMMPLMMGFIFYGVSSGLVLYWLTSNVVGVAQQQVINKLGGDPPKPPAPEEKSKTAAKKKGKGRKK